MTVTADTRRYFTIEFDCISFSAIASDREHVIGLVKGWYRNGDDNYEEVRAEYGEPSIRELTAEEASQRNGFDDARDGGSYPLTTFEMGALLSSEY